MTDDGFPVDNSTFEALGHPNRGRYDGYGGTTDDVIYLLKPGDTILYSDGNDYRKRPLVVQEERHTAWSRTDSGWWGPSWNVEGPQGGEYALSVWYPDDGGIYPQCHRVSGDSFELDMHVHEFMLVDSGYGYTRPIVTDPHWESAPEFCRVVYEFNGEKRFGTVVGEEYGSLVVDPDGHNGAADGARHSLDPDAVLIGRFA